MDYKYYDFKQYALISHNYRGKKESLIFLTGFLNDTYFKDFITLLHVILPPSFHRMLYADVCCIAG